MDSPRLPEVRSEPCSDCPWRRESAPGWLGPHTAEEWEQIAHSDAPIACHITLDGDKGWESKGALQCAGAAIFRSNILKSPRDPDVATLPADRDLVFVFGEFVEHHEQITHDEHIARHRKDPII